MTRVRKTKIDWNNVDWKMSSASIARRYRISVGSVYNARRKYLGNRKLCSNDGCYNIVDPETGGDKGNKRGECRACWCGHNEKPDMPDWRNQSSLAAF